MVILGISAYYHDSAAALLVDGKVVAAACEERFSRKKHDKGFPKQAVSFCVEEANISHEEIDYVVFYEKPLLKFERILTTHIRYAPKSFKAFTKAIPIWLKERLNMKRTITKELRKLWSDHKRWDIRFVEHHFSHAAMAYYTSAFEDTAILVVDAVGESATTSILKGEHDKIILVKQQVFPHSIGLLYSAFTYFLGFKVNSDEYKVMGLAPYGKLDNEETRHFITIIENKLVKISPDGSIILNDKYFTFMYRLKMIDEHIWENLFGLAKRQPNEEISQSHKNLAAAIQHITEKIFLLLARHVKEITHSNRLCISGGCALNCAAMGKIQEQRLFEDVFVPFAPGDDGGAIGAALYLAALMDEPCVQKVSPYLGTHYTDVEIEQALTHEGLSYHFYEEESLYGEVANLLNKGNIISWYQGRMEFGPRALGNRSILADPRDATMKDKVNARVKFREAFRPFAPVVLEEDATSWFMGECSPYMMLTTTVKKGNQKIPAITHVDGSARAQVVGESDNPRLYYLLTAFKELTDCPILLNTSFNVMGEPIVCSPQDAIRTFLNCGLDVLVMGNYVIKKQL